MTGRPLSPAADKYRALAVKLRDRFSGLVFPYTVDFWDEQGHTWRVSCNVKDPQQVDSAYARSLRVRPDAAQLRVLTVDPRQPMPPVGALCEWDGGEAKVEAWGQDRTYTGVRQGALKYTGGLPVPTGDP